MLNKNDNLFYKKAQTICGLHEILTEPQNLSIGVK